MRIQDGFLPSQSGTNTKLWDIPPQIHKKLFSTSVLISIICQSGITIERSVETEVPTIWIIWNIWTDEKHRQEETEPGRNSAVEKIRREKIRGGESHKKKNAGARKGRKVAKHCVFPNDLWLRRFEK